MRRALSRLSDETFDLLIVGGGVTGAAVARDAALRGLSVALIEKADFAGATSAHNSKLVHGGLRYLRNLELGLVRESLRERRVWQRVAPHLVHPLPFLVPLYKAGWRGRATLEAGLALYDALSYDRGRLDDPDQRLPGHRFLSAREALSREPVLDGPGFEGAFLYYDAQMYAPERLALELLIDADAHGAALANYVAAERLLISDGSVFGCVARDAAGGERFDIRAAQTLVAAGPWADLFLEHAIGRKPHHTLLRSKGIHVVVPALTREFALTVEAGREHFFVLPWRGHTLLGTTDTEFTGDPDRVGVSAADIDGFFATIDRYLPSARLAREASEFFYAGLRPLVADGSHDTYGASRRAALIDHAEDGLHGLFSAIGGKWTTSRDLAEKTVDAIVEKRGRPAARCVTKTALLPGGRTGRFRAFLKAQETRHPNIKNIEHLARLYGSRLDIMLGAAPKLRLPLGATGDIGAEVVHAIREEMALTLEDIVMRRTGIGQLGRPAPETLERTARVAAEELGWSDNERQRQVAALAPRFQLDDA